jgi:hypothetical protein
VKLALLVGARLAKQPLPDAPLLIARHLPFERAAANGLVADERDRLDQDRGTFLDRVCRVYDPGCSHRWDTTGLRCPKNQQRGAHDARKMAEVCAGRGRYQHRTHPSFELSGWRDSLTSASAR